MPIETNCKTCGQPFLVKPGRFGKVLNCSTKCASLSRRKHPDSVCQKCGKDFRPLSRSYGQKFCSRTCRGACVRSLPAADRAATTAKAVAQIRGRKRSEADLCKRASTKQAWAKLSGDEAQIMAAYRAAGLSPIPLYAVGKYNIDFAFPDHMVAVEYQGGNWHNLPHKREQDANKAAFLMDQGWHLLTFSRLAKTGSTEIVRATQDALHG